MPKYNETAIALCPHCQKEHEVSLKLFAKEPKPDKEVIDLRTQQRRDVIRMIAKFVWIDVKSIQTYLSYQKETIAFLQKNDLVPHAYLIRNVLALKSFRKNGAANVHFVLEGLINDGYLIKANKDKVSAAAYSVAKDFVASQTYWIVADKRDEFMQMANEC